MPYGLAEAVSLSLSLSLSPSRESAIHLSITCAFAPRVREGRGDPAMRFFDRCLAESEEGFRGGVARACVYMYIYAACARKDFCGIADCAMAQVESSNWLGDNNALMRLRDRLCWGNYCIVKDLVWK